MQFQPPRSGYIYYVRDYFQKPDSKIYLYNSTINWKLWTKIDRFNYTSYSGPDYTHYTYYSLTEYFFYFWVLLILHIYINLLAKIAFSEDFRKTWTLSPLAKFVHCLENTNVPTVWKDWEEDGGNVEDHKRRHRQVVTEMVVIMIIRTIFHAFMLSPVLFTGR